MTDLPECFGAINLARTSPCHHCAAAAMCTRQFTKENEFGVMLWPRISTAPVSVLMAPSVVPRDATVEGPLSGALEAMGLHQGEKGIWKLGKQPVLRIREANLARTAAHYLRSSTMMIANQPSARLGVQITAVYDKADRLPKGTPITTRMLRERRQCHYQCIVVAPSWRTIAELTSELLRANKE